MHTCPSLHALWCCFSEIVALLLENEASPNIVDHKGSTPLHLAAWAGHSDIVRLLLSTQIRVTQLNLKASPPSELLVLITACRIILSSVH